LDVSLVDKGEEVPESLSAISQSLKEEILLTA
jgi:hypothetical protein